MKTVEILQIFGILIVFLVNGYLLARLADENPTVSSFFEDFKELPVLGFLLLPIALPSILLFLLVKLLYYRPFSKD